MSKIKTAFNLLINDPGKIVYVLGRKDLLNWVPDKIYLKMIYYGQMGKKLNLKNPQTFNEKLQWLKLYDRNPDYSNLVDKYAVRDYVKNLIGEEHLIPLIGVYDNFDEIDFNKLPNQFVLKCTHDSGGIVICTDKSKFNISLARNKINKRLKRDFFYFAREWPYKNVKPRIICEKYMVDDSGTQLKDYKIFCFNGIPKLIEVDFDRFTGHKRNIYDTEWNYLPVSIHYPTKPDVVIKKPNKLNEMLKLASVLAKDYLHVRTDFYSINDKVYFGEITFYHEAGFGIYKPLEFEHEMGSWIKLPIENC
jgi:hypothetical protein